MKKKEQYSSCYQTANSNPISSRMLSIIMTVHVSSHLFHHNQQQVVEERNHHHLVDQVLPREIVRREAVETKVVNPLLNIDDGATRSKPSSCKLSQRRRHRLLGPHEHHVDEEEQQKHNKHISPPSLSPCQESYKLYKLCSTRYDAPTGFNCSSSVATYMKCALSQCDDVEEAAPVT